ncbi:MAG TPA: hypothetical protein DF613_11390 [Lachnospiraceae bacterium]|nr:hypothetical protein [Lachnospiraceae bacterium]
MFCGEGDRAYPSWLYPVTQGVITIWERWSSYTHEEGFGGEQCDEQFESLFPGQCAGLVLRGGAWAHPGYEHFILAPVIGGFGRVSGRIDSPFGLLKSGWQLQEEKVIYTCTIPANASATLVLDGDNHELGSGSYEFVVDAGKQNKLD